MVNKYNRVSNCAISREPVYLRRLRSLVDPQVAPIVSEAPRAATLKAYSYEAVVLHLGGNS